ncbi:unnamed protein product [Diplocarpon coronariae]|uniref:Rhodopsin domain-containing protein n=1 Tax=Diplocarpon coronariae TaxID=2795749 RepID=A0A218Z980_9HELO|nr:hypothetical protein B2J93_5961 [Marssonina coronariae]
MSGLEKFNSEQFTILNWIMWSIALVITILRLTVRFLQMKRLFWDDIFAVLGIIFLTGVAALNQAARDSTYLLIALEEGHKPAPQYKNLKDINAAEVHHKYMLFFLVMVFYLTLWSVKISLLLFYRRLLVGLNGYMRWWWIVMWFTIASLLASTLSNFLSCIPLSRRFDLHPGASCTAANGINSTWIASTMDISSDIFIALLPIRLLIGLRIPARQKIGIGAVFSLGAVVICFASIRLVEVLETIAPGNPTRYVSLLLWTILETTVAVIVGSLPTLRTLINCGARNQSSYVLDTARKMRANSTNQSHSGRGHIRLYDIKTDGISNEVRGGYESDEAIKNIPPRPIGGITKTQEISVSSRDANQEDQTSLHSFSCG